MAPEGTLSVVARGVACVEINDFFWLNIFANVGCSAALVRCNFAVYGVPLLTTLASKLFYAVGRFVCLAVHFNCRLMTLVGHHDFAHAGFYSIATSCFLITLGGAVLAEPPQP